MSINKRLSGLFTSRHAIRENYKQREFILDVLPKYSTGAEIGVHEGDFSRLLLQHVQPVQLHLIDPWEYRTEPEYMQSFYGGPLGIDQHALDQRYANVLKSLRKQIKNQQAIVHRQRSAMIAKTFPAEYFDWIYIDGDHLYEQVRLDLSEYGSRVKPGGWIAGGGFRTGAWWSDGVVRAVREYIASVPHSDFITRADQFLIRVDAN
jgi:hypothetical protein